MDFFVPLAVERFAPRAHLGLQLRRAVNVTSLRPRSLQNYEALEVGRLLIISLASCRGSFTSFHSLLITIVARSFAE
jgi:hypothetical protein